MKHFVPPPNALVKLKLDLAQQQELVARLFRSGERVRSRQERSKLFPLLYKLDLMEPQPSR